MPKLFLPALLAIALAAPAAAASAASPAAQIEANAPQFEAALRLARTLYPEEQQIAAAERMVDKDMAAAFESSEDFKALEELYPGLTKTILEEIKPALIRFTRSGLPAYYRRVAAVLTAHLAASEIDDMHAFYLSPTGQKIVRGMHQNATGGAMLAEVMTDPDKPASFSAVADDHRTAAEATKKLIDGSDGSALADLSKKPYFAKLALVGAALRKLGHEHVNEPAPEFEAEVAAIIDRIIDRFESGSAETQASTQNQ